MFYGNRSSQHTQQQMGAACWRDYHDQQLRQPGGWTYVYGRMTLDDAPEIARGAALYATTTDGIVPWRDRPVIFRKQSLARIPPMET